jgi:hypothetical protein
VTTHQIIPDYIRHIGGMDRFDQSMHDYNIGQKSNCWYLRIFYWHVNAALANMRTVTKALVTQSNRQRESMCNDVGYNSRGMNKDPWNKYVNNHMGWFHWMIDLGHGLIARGIAMDWMDFHDDSTRPKWMRQKPLKPCSCKRCIFCKEGLTLMHGQPNFGTPALPTSPASLTSRSQPRTMVAKTKAVCGRLVAVTMITLPEENLQ